MKATVDAKELSGALKAIKAAVQARTTIPILSNVLIRAEDERVSVEATDLDCMARISIPARDVAAGETTVNAAMLTTGAGRAIGDIRLAVTDSQLTAQSKGRHLRLATLPAEDFPQHQWGCETLAVRDAERLRDALSFAAVSASSDDTRWYLQGVYLCGQNAVATDGHILSKTPIASEASGILPLRQIPMMLDALSRDGARFLMSETKWRVETDHAVFAGKLIDGTFPDYHRVIPQEATALGVADRDELLDALASLEIGSERSRAVKFEDRDGVDDGEAFLEINYQTQEGSATAEIALRERHDDGVGFAANQTYLKNVLKSFPPGEIVVHQRSALDPILISHKGDPDTLSVVMPMRA